MWVSKKKWRDLLNTKNLLKEECNEYLSRMSLYMKDYDKIKTELKHYKQLYLDELQKRLELAEIIRKMKGD